MVHCEWELTEEDLKKIKEAEDLYVLFSPDLIMGYGVYGARIVERDGKHILSFDRGNSCD